MSWMIKYEKLDDDQKDFVDNRIHQPGNIWIQGFAGSGKSVMLIHALRTLKVKHPQKSSCFVVYTHALADLFRTGMQELGIDGVEVMTYHRFLKRGKKFDYVFVDEVQDIPQQELEGIRKLSNNLHVAGDSNQSIYDNGVEPSKIGETIDASPFTLNTIYRLTRSVMEAVTKLIPGIGIFGAKRDMTSVDVKIRLGKADNLGEEISYVWGQASEAAQNGYSTVVLLPTHKDILRFAQLLFDDAGIAQWPVTTVPYFGKNKPDYDGLNQYFKSNQLKVEYIGNNHGSLKRADSEGNVIIMTYHSVKGLDFSNVYLPFLSSALTVGKNDSTLFMVAMTRSKRNLYLTYTGELHMLAKSFEASCHKITISDNKQKIDTLDFDF